MGGKPQKNYFIFMTGTPYKKGLSGNKTEDFSDIQCPAVCVQTV
jgi:hypothetical protein